MADAGKPLLIKRYASRRLYNTESSDYVTLDDIAGFIRAGRAVRIVDLKSGDDLTRQYLLQIIAEHESRGENVLPIDVLTDLVRSYTAQAQSVVPQFLAMSFEMLRQGPGALAEKMTAINPMVAQMKKMPGFDAMQRQQQAFLETMMAGWTAVPGLKPGASEGAATDGEGNEATPPAKPPKDTATAGEDLSEIRRQLAALEAKLSKLDR